MISHFLVEINKMVDNFTYDEYAKVLKETMDIEAITKLLNMLCETFPRI